MQVKIFLSDEIVNTLHGGEENPEVDTSRAIPNLEREINKFLGVRDPKVKDIKFKGVGRDMVLAAVIYE